MHILSDSQFVWNICQDKKYYIKFLIQIYLNLILYQFVDMIINNIEQIKLFNNLLLFFQNKNSGDIIFIFLSIISKLNFDEVIK